MTKTCKRILLSVSLTLLFVLCLGTFAACGGNGGKGDTETYTITVMKDATAPAEGVDVKIHGYSKTQKTDAYGKVEFSLVPNDYTVDLVAKTIPAGYDAPKEEMRKLTKDGRELTITLEKIGYTVKLVNPDGSPYYAAGVMVTICETRPDGSCKTPVLLQEDGTAFLNYPADEYHVQIRNLPAGAQYECDADGYYIGEGKDFTAANREMTIVITPASN